VLEDSQSAGGAGNANGSAVTATQLRAISGLTAINDANLSLYQEAIADFAGFSNPPATAEIQGRIDSGNAVETLRTAVAGADSSAITIALLQAIDVNGVNAGYEAAYKTHLTQPGWFQISSHATVAMAIASANAFEAVKSAAEQGSSDGINLQTLQAIVPLQSVQTTYESDYLSAIRAANSIATVEELQALVNEQNAWGKVREIAAGGRDAASLSFVDLEYLTQLDSVHEGLMAQYRVAIVQGGNAGVESLTALQQLITAANAADDDNDGLSNASEVLGFSLQFASGTRVVQTAPADADSDNDGLSDGFEVYASLGATLSDLSVAVGDNDGDGVANTRRDAVFARLFNADRQRLLAHQNNGRTQLQGIPFYDGSAWRSVSTDPQREDTDGDGFHDSVELELQQQFYFYSSFDTATAQNILRKLNPAEVFSGQQLPLRQGQVQYSDYIQVEQDSDGGGRPDIEEWWAGTDANNPGDDAPYRGCSNAGIPAGYYAFPVSDAGKFPEHNQTQCAMDTQWQAMRSAGFRFVPGGFDVDGDGNIENGFWISQFEAKPGAGTVPATSVPSMSEYVSANLGLLDTAGGRFSLRTCRDGGHGADLNNDGVTSPGSTPANCRPAEFPLTAWDNSGNSAALAGVATTQPVFTAAGQPLVSVSAIEANLLLQASPVTSGPNSYALELPSTLHWQQMVQLAINNERNWTNWSGDGRIDTSGGSVVRGHTDNENRQSVVGTALDAAGVDVDDVDAGFFKTGDGSEYASQGDSVNGSDQRRTHILQNGVVSRDFTLPRAFGIVVWDLGGNVWEWTRDMVASRQETSVNGSRTGGDRFLDGGQGWVEFDNASLNSSAMPAWMFPRLNNADATLLDSALGAGSYYDGTDSSGSFSYGGFSFGANTQQDYAVIRRGGLWGLGADSHHSGIAAAILESSPTDRRTGVGFRAVMQP
jgi:hypothetical protein